MFLNQGFKGLNEIWRYAIGILIIFSFYFIGQIPLTLVQLWQIKNDQSIGSASIKKFEATMDFSIFNINKNIGFILLLSMFIFAMAGLYMVVTKLHQKKMKDLITPYQNIDLKRILFGFTCWAGLSILLESISYFIFPEVYSFNFSGSNFIVLLVISLVFLPVQTSFEELFFRGYVMQGVAVFSKYTWMPVLLSSIFFGLVHGTNPEVSKFGFWTMQSYYFMAAVFLALITVLDDRLELALGVHAATNIIGATMLTYEGSVLQTDSLFRISEIKPWLMIVSFLLGAFIFIIICYKKYTWPSLNIINQKVGENPVASTDSNLKIY